MVDYVLVFQEDVIYQIFIVLEKQIEELVLILVDGVIIFHAE